jgi:uncharacterized cupredoxin-like copper-binding protein
MPRITARALGIIVASTVAVSMAACSSSEPKQTAAEADAAKAAAAALFTGPAGQTVSIEMTDLKYSNTALTAKTGAVIEVSLANKGSIEHDFTLAKIPGDKAFRVAGKDQAVAAGKNEVHAHLNSGESGAVRLNVSQAGTYEFWCTVAGHKEAGMKGTLTVQ